MYAAILPFLVMGFCMGESGLVQWDKANDDVYQLIFQHLYIPSILAYMTCCKRLFECKLSPTFIFDRYFAYFDENAISKEFPTHDLNGQEIYSLSDLYRLRKRLMDVVPISEKENVNTWMSLVIILSSYGYDIDDAVICYVTEITKSEYIRKDNLLYFQVLDIFGIDWKFWENITSVVTIPCTPSLKRLLPILKKQMIFRFNRHVDEREVYIS